MDTFCKTPAKIWISYFLCCAFLIVVSNFMSLTVMAQEKIITRKLVLRHLPRDAAAVQLEQALKKHRIVAEVYAEGRESALLVRAEEQAHPLIAAVWQGLDKAPANEAKVILVAAWQEGASNEIALRHISPAELEQQLITAFPKLQFDREGNNLTARLPGEERSLISITPATRTVKFEGTEKNIAPWRKVLQALDAPLPASGDTPAIIPVPQANAQLVQQAMQIVQASNRQPKPLQFVAQAQPGQPAVPAQENVPNEEEIEGPIGPVTIEILDGLDVIVVRGKKRDVERVQKIIADIEKQSQITTPEIEVYELKHIDGKALADLLAQIYDQVFGARQSRVSITPLIKPNALLLIGRKESIATLKELITKLDVHVAPQTQLRVFPLKYASAGDAAKTVTSFFSSSTTGGANNAEPRTGLGTRVNVVSDFRTNSLIVQASQRDLMEVAELLKRIDVTSSSVTNEVRLFRLKNALAEELAPILQEAVSGQRATGGGNAANNANNNTQATRPNASLQLLQLDGEGRKTLESGILSEVKITADPRGNTLVVTGPAQSMELIGKLIEQLDLLPSAEAQIKVFTMVNGDAQTLVNSLQQLFGQATGGQANNQLPLQTATGSGDSTLVPLRFGVDQRTNSVIASGSSGDLEVVERLLVRLDEGDIRRRKTTVYRLRNAPAIDVSNAINQFLQNQRQVTQATPTLVSQTEQLEREVVVVPERVSNSLLVSATPVYYDEIAKIVEDLDRRPPMVIIQVLIAEVTLNNLDEFGVELGLQDSLLFDRGIGSVGFPFNNQALGNNSDATSLATRNNVAGQALSNFSLARSNSGLGYGGLVLSASSESVSMLLRALQQSKRMQVVSRPQVQTLDNQPAFVQVGARVPVISNSTPNQFGQVTNSTELVNVGVLLGVTPRTSPDGLIVMEINAEKSEVGPESTAIPIFVNNNGDVIRSPQILITTAQTTVSAQSGQTVILGGLISKSREQETRRVPYLSDIPVLGRLFRHDLQTEKKSELLIIMTPYVVRNNEDIELLNARETERMNWCLSDVADVHGDLNLSGGGDMWKEKQTPVIFPDSDPTASSLQPSPIEALPNSQNMQALPPATTPQLPVNNPPVSNTPPLEAGSYFQQQNQQRQPSPVVVENPVDMNSVLLRAPANSGIPASAANYSYTRE